MSIVEKGSSIVKERKGTHCVVIFASAVAKKRSRTNGSICVSGIDEKCPGANSRVEAATGVASERKETDGRIVPAGGKAKQRVLPFRRVAAGVTAIRWRADR